MGELSNRRRQTTERIEKLRDLLGPAAALISDKACVYATGSFGRREASAHSDLDLFILGKEAAADSGRKSEPDSQLNRLDEICIKADLIRATRELGIPDFSGDGKYLVHYSVKALTETLGKPDDDATNTFTARLLLLLESFPLLEEEVYQQVTEEVVEAYWRDYDDHKDEFVPAYLGNDILRLWRTFCVNYEASTETEPEEKKAKRKLKNYKLKHSRLLTCYSAILHLLSVYAQQKTVSPSEALRMIRLTPTERLEALLNQSAMANSHPTVGKILELYDHFLQFTNAPEKELVDRFLDEKKARDYIKSAYALGDLTFEAIELIGDGNRFHRLLVV